MSNRTIVILVFIFLLVTITLVVTQKLLLRPTSSPIPTNITEFPSYPDPEHPFPAPISSVSYMNSGYKYYEASYNIALPAENPLEDLSDPLNEAKWIMDKGVTDLSPTSQIMKAHDPQSLKFMTVTAQKTETDYKVKITIQTKI